METTRIQPKVSIREEDKPKTATPDEQIVVFVCPTPGCGNFYGSPNFMPEDISLDDVQYKRGEQGDRVELHTRRECPACWVREGKRVPRIPYIVVEYIQYDEMVAAVAKVVTRKLEQAQEMKED